MMIVENEICSRIVKLSIRCSMWFKTVCYNVEGVSPVKILRGAPPLSLHLSLALIPSC